jgi:hypothetical protein
MDHAFPEWNANQLEQILRIRIQTAAWFIQTSMRSLWLTERNGLSEMTEV